jgi:hypothetical protein
MRAGWRADVWTSSATATAKCDVRDAKKMVTDLEGKVEAAAKAGPSERHQLAGSLTGDVDKVYKENYTDPGYSPCCAGK